MKYHQRLYFIILYVLYALDIILILGLVPFDTSYIVYLSLINKFFIAIYLMYKTNPFTKSLSISFSSFDKKLVFSSAFYLLISAFALAHIDINELVKKNIKKIIPSSI